MSSAARCLPIVSRATCPHCVSELEITKVTEGCGDGVHVLHTDGTRHEVTPSVAIAVDTRSISIGDFWRDIAESRQQEVSRDHWKEIDNSVKFWGQFCTDREADIREGRGAENMEELARDPRLVRPGVSEIGYMELIRFRDWMSKRHSNNRTNIYMRRFCSVLKVAAEKFQYREFVPKIPNLEVEVELPAWRYWPEEELRALWKACEAASWPRSTVDGRPVDAALYWRCAIVFWYTFGQHTRDVWSYDDIKNKPGLMYDQITRSNYPPGERPKPSLYNEHGWITYRRNKTKKKNKRWHSVPMTADARRWLDKLGPHDGGRVFPFPGAKQCFYGWKMHNKKPVRSRGWGAIVEAAGVKETLPVAKLIELFRKDASTRWGEAGGESVATHVLGNAPKGITDQHYRDILASVVRASKKEQNNPIFQDAA